MSDLHSIDYTVTFGDCDPAGIVFYPNIYGWFDRCFHDWLARFGGHAALCRQVGAVGAGLMESDARFRRPMRPNDRITVHMTGAEWAQRTLRLTYTVMNGDTLAATGTELRGLFKPTETGITAGEMAELRALLD